MTRESTHKKGYTGQCRSGTLGIEVLIRVMINLIDVRSLQSLLYPMRSWVD